MLIAELSIGLLKYVELARKTPNAVTDYLGQRMYQYALARQVSTFGRGWYCRLARAAQLAFKAE